MAENKETRYVGVKENLAYGFANAGQCFGYNLVAGGYLSLFFTKVFEIPAQAVATMILVLGIWDTINDPLMGGIIDRTRTKYGKLRPYLLFVPLPLAVATIMLFAGPEILADAKSTTIKIVYMYISYFIWEFFYTIGDVPFWGMSTAISPSPSDRTRAISTARFISSILGGLSTTFLVVMMDLSNNGVWGLSLSKDFLILAIIAAFMLVFVFSLAGRKTKERVMQSVKEPSVIEGFKVLLKNKPLMLIIIGNVVGTLGGLAGVFQTYYYSEVLNLNSAVLWISLPGTIFGFLTYLLIPKLKKKFDNRQIVLMNGLCRVLVGGLVFVTGLKFYNSSVLGVSILLGVQNFIFSFFNTVNMVIPTEMIGDTVDYMEWKTGERTEGVSFSVLTFVGKLTGSISTSVGTALLPLIGLSFVKGDNGQQVAVKGEKTDLYIWALFTFVPHILALLGLVPYLFYDLTGNKLTTIREELKSRRDEASKTAPAEGETTISEMLEADAKKAQEEVDKVNHFVDILKSSTIKTPWHIIRLILFFTPLASMCLPMYWAGHKNVSLITFIMSIINHGFDLGAMASDKSYLFAVLTMICVIIFSLAVIINSLFSATKNGFKRNMIFSTINTVVLATMSVLTCVFGGYAKIGLLVTLLIYALEFVFHLITGKPKKKIAPIICSVLTAVFGVAMLVAPNPAKAMLLECPAVPMAEENQIGVVSFNVASAFGTGLEDTDSMVRCDRFASYMTDVQPDFIGTQEMNSYWMSQLEINLPDYDGYGVKRGGDSEEKNSEMNSIFWQKDKYTALETNTIWLSQTPNEESKYTYIDADGNEAEAGCNRVCTYAILESKDKKQFALLNTHLDNSSEEARLFGAGVVLEQIEKIKTEYTDISIVLTGDFNETANEEAVAMLSSKLNCSNPENIGGATYQEWGYRSTGNEPIDFIFSSGKSTNYTVLNNISNGYISDHYGIYSVVEI